jgi:hypothetical protein
VPVGQLGHPAEEPGQRAGPGLPHLVQRDAELVADLQHRLARGGADRGAGHAVFGGQRDERLVVAARHHDDRTPGRLAEQVHECGVAILRQRDPGTDVAPQAALHQRLGEPAVGEVVRRADQAGL